MSVYEDNCPAFSISSNQYVNMIRAAVNVSEAASRIPIRFGDDWASANVSQKRKEKKKIAIVFELNRETNEWFDSL